MEEVIVMACSSSYASFMGLTPYKVKERVAIGIGETELWKGVIEGELEC